MKSILMAEKSVVEGKGEVNSSGRKSVVEGMGKANSSGRKGSGREEGLKVNFSGRKSMDKYSHFRYFILL